MSEPTPLRPGHTIAWLGLGAMGLRMAGHCARRGFVVQACDPAFAAGDPRLPAGVSLAADAAAAVTGAAALVTCLPSDATLRAALDEGGALRALPAGAPVIDCGTTSLRTTRALADRARALGHEWVDAPVSGSTAWADDGSLTALVGGGPGTVAAVRPLIGCFAARVFHLGATGAGQTAKLCHQLTFMATLLGLREALELGERGGLERDALLTAIGACVAPSHVIEFATRALGGGAWQHDDGTLGLLVKDLGAVTELADALDAELPLARTVAERLETLAAGGGARRNLFALLAATGEPPAP